MQMASVLIQEQTLFLCKISAKVENAVRNFLLQQQFFPTTNNFRYAVQGFGARTNSSVDTVVLMDAVQYDGFIYESNRSLACRDERDPLVIHHSARKRECLVQNLARD